MAKQKSLSNKIMYWFLKFYFKFIWAVFKNIFINLKLLFTAKWLNKLWFFSIIPLFMLVKYISFWIFTHEWLQVISFLLMFNYVVLSLPIRLMEWKGLPVLQFNLDSIKELFKTTPEEDELRKWNLANWDKLEKLQRSIFDIFSINRLKIDWRTPEETKYIKRSWPILVHDTINSEIEIKYILPNWLPFTKVDNEHIKQSIKQVFQKYFSKTEEIEFYIKWDVFSVRNYWEKESFDYSKNFKFPKLMSLMYSKQLHKNPLDFSVWVDENHEIKTYNLRNFPHLLVAWESWGWKSVALTDVLVSLMKNKLNWAPIDFVIIDPKEVEFWLYEKLPGFTVETDVNKAVNVLKNLVDEMNRRYSILKELWIKKIEHYHNKGNTDMNYIVAIVDEFWDIMVWTDKESKDNWKQIEALITKLVQKARAVWIHCVLATQNPIWEVITSNIKANVWARLWLRTSDTIKSRTIIDSDDLSTIKSKWEAFIKTENWLEHIKTFFIDEEKELPEFIKFYKRSLKEVEVEESNFSKNFDKDKYDILFEKIKEEKTFKIKWYSEITGFTQQEIRDISKKLQEQNIIEKLPNNSLKLTDENLLNEDLKKSLQKD